MSAKEAGLHLTGEKEMFITTPLLFSTQNWISLGVVILFLGGIGWLLRPRQRCPKDRHALELVAPAKGKHMVFRCPKCGYQRKSRAPVGRRR